MVLWSLENMIGGEIFVPKIPSYRILDLADAIGPNVEKKFTGVRPGEKIHEEMITSADSFSSFDLGKYYSIFPSDGTLEEKYKAMGINMSRLKRGFSYNSGTNTNFLSIDELRNLIKLNVDSNFEPI